MGAMKRGWVYGGRKEHGSLDRWVVKSEFSRTIEKKRFTEYHPK